MSTVTRSSNYHVDIIAPIDRELLNKALELALFQEKATHYYTEDRRLVLCWGQQGSSLGHPLPFPITANNAVLFVEEWLKYTPPPSEEPDSDGLAGKGFRVLANDDQVPDGAICVIFAYWSEYHK